MVSLDDDDDTQDWRLWRGSVYSLSSFRSSKSLSVFLSHLLTYSLTHSLVSLSLSQLFIEIIHDTSADSELLLILNEVLLIPEDHAHISMEKKEGMYPY